ncbi:hypothetical protein H2198_001857 [Neophaeococcomyces mojaviensis]|uniref:Uncharacterized protein n=1 Tax=Neophaeococcomyces mojaviensis TaxID=3383035 RepID=A0ACC3AFY6_9EURO|nr:hypothetical protein H2198_001857 [Knufia sp. JES_112]
MSFSTFSVEPPCGKAPSGESFFVLESAGKSRSLQFVQHDGVEDSQRQKELRVSELRAHAARTAHHNKKKKQAQKLAKDQETLEEQETKQAAVLEQKRKQSISPLSFAVSESKKDPFGTSVLSSTPGHLLQLLDAVFLSLNMAFRPVQKGTSHPDVLMWRRETISFPALSYSIVAGAATMSLIGRRSLSPSQCQDLDHARLQYTSLAVSQVRKELNDPAKATSDTLLFAILCLGCHDDVEPGEEEDYSNQIISPLTMGSALHVFSRLKMSAIHFTALVRLLQLKGGLDKIKIPIFRELMSYIALVQATKEGIRPQLPFVDSHILTTVVNQVQNNPSAPLSPVSIDVTPSLSEGFAELDQVIHDQNLVEALQSAAMITNSVEELCRNSSSANILEIVNLRNKTQYLLTNLEPRSLLADSPVSDCLYEVCRLTTLIFSDMIIFPTPALTGVRQRLALEILIVFNTPTLQASWKLYSDLLNWATMVGAVASMNVPEDKQLFVDIFEKRAVYPDSQAFLMALRKFLWSDLLTDRAQQVWIEARAYLTPESME